MTDFLSRALLVKLDVDRLNAEAQRCRDPQRLREITAEMDTLVESLREIRRQQLLADLEPTSRRSAWWRRVFGGAS